MNWIVCVFFLSIVSGECPEDWSRFQKTCLALFEEKLVWSRAQATCRSYGARLATLETKAKDLNMKMFLQTLKTYHQDPIWVGGSDSVKESHWVWADIDLNTFTYTNWNPTQPNDLHNNIWHGEDCLALLVDQRRYGWMDNSCEERPLPFVCERDVE